MVMISRIILVSVFAFSMAPKAEGAYQKIGMLPDGEGGRPYIEISFDDKQKIKNKKQICETSILITLPSNSDSFNYPCPAVKTGRSVANQDVLIVDDKIYSDTKDQLVHMLKAPCQREYYNPRRSELLTVEECNLIKSAMEKKVSVKTLKDEENERLRKEREAEAERLRKEAEAEAERLRKEAEAERLRMEAEAERIRKEQEAEAERLRKEREAEAERLRKEKEAEAERLRKEKEAELERIRKEKEEEISKIQREKDAAQARLEKEQADAQEKLKQAQLEQERLQNTLKEQERLRQEKKEAKERKRQEENLAREKELKEAQDKKSRAIVDEGVKDVGIDKNDQNKKTKASTNLSRILSNILGFSTSGSLKMN